MALTQQKRADLVVQPVAWGLVVGLINVAAPLAFWWLDLATVHALTITLIAAVYVGFAVADGRPKVIAVETAVTFVFLLIAATAVTGSAWLLVIAYFGHGCKDLWQHRTQFVTGTRWWPPFCAAVDAVVAGSIAVLILTGVQFH
jgi:fucose 4-O-acetylase-like acetyltransferase